MKTVGKRIILCSDGTGNSSASLFKTNVWRLYQALDLSRPDQIAQYDDGVGTSSFKPLAILGSMFGFGLANNVRDLYAFVCRHYRQGDSIYGFGFSRGAFTIRVLSGLIASQGIVRYDNEADLQRKVRRAYQDYRRSFRTRSVLTGWIHDGLHWVRDGVVDIYDQIGRYPTYNRPQLQLRKTGALPEDPQQLRQLEEQAILDVGNIPARIEFLGLWDTVDAYGLPVDEMTRAVDDYFWPLTMRDRRLRLNVNYARHALALDDERNTFHPVLWHEDGSDEGKPVSKRRLLQVWFSGMHANVGGGYPIDSLSHVPLIWMIDQIDERNIASASGRKGLSFIKTRVEAYRQSADPLGPMSDSRAGFGAYYRYQPRRFPLLAREAPPELIRGSMKTIKPHGKWFFQGLHSKLTSKAPPTNGDESEPAVSPQQSNGSNKNKKPSMFELDKPILHHSVVQRLVSGVENYAPIIIPERARVLNKQGHLCDLDQHLLINYPRGRRGNNLQLSPPAKQQTHQDLIDNLVWWRRVFYFLTLFTTLFFAAGPFYLDVERTDGNDPTKFAWPSAVAEAAGSFVPGFFKLWIEAYAANPYWFASVIGLLVILNAGGTRLKAMIDNSAGIAWRKAVSGGHNTMELTAFGKRLAKLRKSNCYKKSFRWLGGSALPGVFTLVFLLVGLAIAMQALFHLTASPKSLVASAAFDVCRSRGKLSPVEAGGSSAISPFDTRCQAWPSGLALEGGMRYEITLRVVAPAPEAGRICSGTSWGDKSYPADPFGLYKPEDASLLWHAQRFAIFGFFLPFRRHIDRPWFTLLAQMGEDGRAVAPLLPKKPPGHKPEERQTFISEFTAQRTGELFLYVNDAVNVFGMDFYRNNCGRATVSLRPLDWDPGFNR